MIRLRDVMRAGLAVAQGRHGRYANADPRHRPPGFAAAFRWGVWEPLTGRRRPRPPGPPAPRVAPDRDLLAAPPAPADLTWLGHAGFLLRLGGATFLVDAVLGPRVGWLYPRYLAAPLALADLPPLDAVLLTHNHYDHLDAGLVRGLRPEVPVVVPLGLGRWLARRGRAAIELGWWQQATIAGVRVTLVPARHWSRRGVLDVNRSWWGGFVLEGAGVSVYHAGDSAWFDGFAAIGERFPRLDAALLPIGAYEPRWFMGANHMDPEEAGRAFLALGARRLVPMHWGTFQLTDEPLVEPRDRLAVWWREHGPRDGRELVWLAVGETRPLAAGGEAGGAAEPALR